jgi:hypothetical protein
MRSIEKNKYWKNNELFFFLEQIDKRIFNDVSISSQENFLFNSDNGLSNKKGTCFEYNEAFYWLRATCPRTLNEIRET